jgi:hypothetical protein
MKNPLRQLHNGIRKIIWRCPYWRVCPNFDRDKCYDSWVMNGCGKYRKFAQQEVENTTNRYEKIIIETDFINRKKKQK